MTKFEKFKDMSIEDMAREIFDKVEEGCRYCSLDSIIDYLNNEVKE